MNVTAWRCSTCNEPVYLTTAREHYDACPGGDRAETIDYDDLDDLDDDDPDAA